MGQTCNCNSVIINVGDVMKFFFELGMLTCGPAVVTSAFLVLVNGAMVVYTTPPGCKFVRLTLFEIIVVMGKLWSCVFWTSCRALELAVSSGGDAGRTDSRRSFLVRSGDWEVLSGIEGKCFDIFFLFAGS